MSYLDPNDKDRDLSTVDAQNARINQLAYEYEHLYTPENYHVVRDALKQKPLFTRNLDYMNSPDNDSWLPAKAFYNGFFNSFERGVVGMVGMISEAQIEMRKIQLQEEQGIDFDYNENPVASLLNNPNGHLAPYNVEAKTKVGQLGYDLITGAGQLIRQAILGYVTGGASMALMGTEIAGNDYTELRNEGVSRETAKNASMADAILQAPFEYLSAATLTRGLPKSMRMSFIPETFKGRVFERIITEGVTELIQEYPDEYSSIIAKAVDEGKSAGEIANIVLEKLPEVTANAFYNGFIGGFLGGVFGIPGAAVEVGINKQAHRALQEQAKDRAKRARDAGTDPLFAATVDDLNLHNQTVAIDAEALLNYAQEKGMDKVTAALAITEDELRTAAENGQNIDVLEGHYSQAENVFEGFLDKMNPHVSFNDGEYTPSTEDRKRAQIREYDEDQRVKSRVREQLDELELQMDNSGRKFTSIEKTCARAVLEQRAYGWAEETGESADKFFETHKLAFEDTEDGKGRFVLYQFGGHLAHGVWDTYRKVLEMQEQGKSAAEIEKETGWKRTQNGQWEFEFDAKPETIDLKKLYKENLSDPTGVNLNEPMVSTPLSVLYKNDLLYKFYPHMEKTRVELNFDPDLTINEVGSYNPSTNVISLNPKWVEAAVKGEKISLTRAGKTTPGEYDAKRVIMGTIIHESQHGIQKKQNWATGGSPEDVRAMMSARIDAINNEISARSYLKADRWNSLPAEIEKAANEGNTEEVKKLTAEYNKINERIPDWMKEEINELQAEKDDLQAMLDEYYINPNTGKPWGETPQEDEAFNEHQKKLDLEFYRRLRGEQQARLAEERAMGDENVQEHYDEYYSPDILQDYYGRKTITIKERDLESLSRGSISMNEVSSVIKIFSSGDISTIIHETGHYFFEALAQEVANGTATADQIKDFETLLKYAGTTQEEWYSLDEKGREKYHEVIAEALESYFMEDTAPNLSVRRVFNKIKNFLLDLYGGIYSDRRSENAIPLTDDVRRVFDRWFAAREAIRNTAQIDGYLKTIADDEEILKAFNGLDERRKKQLEQYAKDAEEKAVGNLTAKVMENFEEERAEAIANYRSEMLPKIQEQVKQEPLYKASEQVQALTVAFEIGSKKGRGEISAREAAVRYSELLTRLRDEETLTQKESEYITTFDMVAESNQFSSGEALAQEIRNNNSEQREITYRTDQAVQQKFPDILKEHALAWQAAREAIYNDQTGMLVAMEAQLIAEKIGKLTESQARERANRAQAAAKYQIAKNKAHTDLTESLKIKDAIKITTFVTAERNAAAKAAKLLAQGKFEEAQRYKDIQLYNHACVMESIRLRAAYDHYKAKFDKLAKAKKEVWKNERNFSQAMALMQRFGARSRKDYDPSMKTESLSDYLADMDDIYGDVNVPDWIQREDIAVPNVRRDLTFSQLEDVMNSLANIQAIVKKQGMDAWWNKELTYKDIRDGATEQLNKRKTVYTPQPGSDQPTTRMEKLKRFGQRLRVSLRNMDNFFERMDDWEYAFFCKHFAEPLKHAADEKAEYMMDLQYRKTKIFRELLPDVKAEQAYAAKFAPTELRGVSIDKFTLLQMGMNLGNQGNIDRLCSSVPEGFENSDLWIPNDVEGTKQNIIRFLGKYLTEADFKYIQANIDIAGAYWGDLAAVKRRKEGFAPKKVEAVPFVVKTADGKTIVVKGGYFPLVRDSRMGSRPAGSPILETDEMQGRNIRTMKIDTGSMKERSNTKYPVSLKWGAEMPSLEQNIQYICYSELMDNFRRFFNDKEMYALMKQKLGPDSVTAFREFLEKTANQRNLGGDIGEANVIDTFNWLRSKTTTVAIMLNLKVIMQNFANVALYGNAVEGYTYADSLAAYGNFIENMQTNEGWNGTKEFVFARSSFMKERSEFPDITLRDVLATTKLNKIEREAIRFGSQAMVFTDNLTAIPNWLQAYTKKINAGATEQEAIDYADRLVRRTLGSSRPSDVAPIFVSDNRMVRMMTMFQSFFNTQYNQWEREANIYLKTGDKWRLCSFVFSKWLVFSLLNLITCGINPFAKDDDDYRELSKELMMYPSTLMGPIGTVAGALLERAWGMKSFGYRMSAVQNSIETWERLAGKVNKVATGKGEIGDLAEPLMAAAGIAVGVPSQFNKWFWNGYDILFGDMSFDVEDLYKRRPLRERKK